MSVDASPAVSPCCASHPDVPAGATCQRCGNFVCTTCSTWVLSAVYCPSCAARPEVNYLETFRLTLWGRRDVWTYLVALVTLMLVGGGLSALLIKEPIGSLVLFASAAVGVPFFLGMRWARVGLMLVPPAVGLVAVALSPSEGAPVLLLAIVPFLVALQIYLDPRNRLFFRIDIPERQLQKLWHMHANNPLARHALSFGVASVFMPLLVPVALVCGVIALRRVDPHARPPIGRRGQALASIALAVTSVVLWTLLFWPRLAAGVQRVAEG